ncbi:chain-length determining protein [Bacteroidales bacterium SW299]|nr:chain-length determining protein [Bacteroidales bacterium SW299]
MTEQKNDTTEKKQQEIMEIDFIALFKKLVDNRKKIYKAIGIGALIGLIIGFSLPKEYEVKVSLSPESGLNNTGGLASIASMFGLSNGSASLGEDALSFNMFPEIVKTTPFLLEMLETPVMTKDSVSMSLYDYLDIQKKPWWGYMIGLPGKAIGGVVSLFKDKPEEKVNQPINPFKLTREQSGRIRMLRKVLDAETDKKTSMTTVSIRLQDPLATALVADSAITKLQRYITDYRTRKAQQDCIYLEKITQEREAIYIKAQKEYAHFADANKNIILQSVKAESERLQKAASAAYEVYSQMETQLQLARAKVQEAKPVFAVVEPSTVPLHPSSPKKMILLIGFVFLAFICESVWILFGEDFWNSFKAEMKNPKAGTEKDENQ